MSEPDPRNVTALLHRSSEDPAALEAVYEIVYADLRRLAGRQLGPRGADQTLSVTALVNEAFLKLSDRTGGAWNDRLHFLRVAARAMRQITVDHARAKLSKKRGSGQSALPLIEPQVAAETKSEMILALEEGLQQLAADNERLVRVVEFRFFAGLTAEETAAALDTSRRTVQRDWEAARAWLKTFLTSDDVP